MESRGEGHPLTGELATPMMKQYRRIKATHPDTILLFRLGDFYEMFFEDAEVGARDLEITLTSRTTGGGQRVPMCGVPCHAVDSYIARLVELGHRVAVCDQVEDPRQAKGLVRREVVRVVTPGTVLDPTALPEKANNYLAAVTVGASGTVGLAWLDFSTGEFRTTEFRGEGALGLFADELGCLDPAETVVDPAVGGSPDVSRILGRLLRREPVPFRAHAFRQDEAARTLLEHFGVVSLEAYGCADKPLAVAAAGGLLAYLKETQVGRTDHILTLRTDSRRGTMPLDAATRRNLELVEPLRPGGSGPGGPGRGGGAGRAGGGASGRVGTLLGVLDRTVTSAGGRRLRSWLLHPLTDREHILARQEAVAELAARPLVREECRSLLGGVHDLERLVARAATGGAGARDLLALGESLDAVPGLAASLENAGAAELREVAGRLHALPELRALIRDALVDEPPAGLKDGGLIRDGYSAEIDALRQGASEAKAWIAALEAEERRRTGVKSLKVGYNRVFGYYIEVTRSNLGSVPEGYQRRQTLAGAERFVTAELKEKEAIVLGAEDKLKELEYEIFRGVRDRVAAEAASIQETAAALADLDALLSLAEVGARYGYCRPDISEESGIVIKGGRHPVVERLQTAEEFVPNDSVLGREGPTFVIITGPNMAGKSTYCRQVALIALMAQIGSLVPADKATIGIVDRIFTRIGASDELSGGRSTFMVEMSEAANILNHATRRSLVILDEIGRGTSTYDGLGLAWAVAEHIVREIGALTLFATHYHELTMLEDELPGVGNYCVTVREMGEDIVFLRKVVRGAVDRSYGIQVARLAGLPASVIARAREILAQLETAREARDVVAAGREADGSAAGEGAGERPGGTAAGRGGAVAAGRLGPAAHGRGSGSQLILFEALPSEIEREILELDLVNLTPLEALSKLDDMQKRLRKGRG